MENLPEPESKSEPKDKHERAKKAAAWLAVGFIATITAVDIFSPKKDSPVINRAVPSCEDTQGTSWHRLSPDPQNADRWAKYFGMSREQFLNSRMGTVHCDSPVTPLEISAIKVDVEDKIGPCIPIGYQNETNPIDRSNDEMEDLLVLCAGETSEAI